MRPPADHGLRAVGAPSPTILRTEAPAETDSVTEAPVTDPAETDAPETDVPETDPTETGAPETDTQEPGKTPAASGDAGSNPAPESSEEERNAFYDSFWELDRDETEAWLAEHPRILSKGYKGILVDESGLGQDGLWTSIPNRAIRSLPSTRPTAF